MTGRVARTIQAPSANFVVATTMATTPVTAAPRPFTVARRRHPRSRFRAQCRTSPACDSVNAMKTPIV